MNLFEIWLVWLETLGDKFGSLLIIGINFGCVYGLYRLIKYFIHYHAECQNEFIEQRERKRHSQNKMDEINRELDEIEATLNAVSEAENSDGKITPIWNSKPPKQ